MAEAAGFTLAVLPLLISAVENYEVVFRPLVTYCRYAKEAERFTNQLKAQRTVFRNECHLLLSSVCDQPQQVDAMLNISGHPLHSDMDIDRRILRLLDSSYDTCMSTLKLINDTLEEIGEETKSFGALTGSQDESAGRARCYLIRQRLKISFSKPRLIGTINNLRNYNQDFCMLSRQIGRLEEGRAFKGTPRPANKQAASYFGNVQDASKKLHHALANSWSCESHTEHSASICLNITHIGRPQTISSTVRFDLILTSPTSNIVSTEEVLRLSVESATDEPEDAGSGPLPAEVNPLTTLTASLNEVALGPLSKSRRIFLRNYTETPENGEPLFGSESVSLLPPAAAGIYTFIKFSYMSGLPTEDRGLHALCVSCPTALSWTPPQFIARRLAPSQELPGFIPVEEKLRLAMVLAVTVLQFHATPWLPTNWRSKDVLFFAFKDALAEESLRTPYLETSLAETRNAFSNATQGTLCFAPNRTLYNLGVMLLELGFDAPLSSLQQASDLKDGHETPYSEFLAASRLKRIVGTRLGARYERLVIKCLQCDFGLGSSELDSPEVQNAFFQDVVCELNLCLKAATKF